MAIPRSIGRALIDLARRDGWHGGVLQLGAQHVYLTGREVGATGWQFVDDGAFFRSLGFGAVDSCDVDAEAGATRVLDLNQPVTLDLVDCYDAVLDGGTMEHVFDVPQVLKNVHALLREGGRVIHLAPCSNYLDHGYYQFSPRLLHDWYRANGWTIEHAEVFVHRRHWARSRWSSLRYVPGVLDDRAMGGFGRRLVLVLFVAAKAAGATADVVPQQHIDRAPPRRQDAVGHALDRVRARLWPLRPLGLAGRARPRSAR